MCLKFEISTVQTFYIKYTVYACITPQLQCKNFSQNGKNRRKLLALKVTIDIFQKI